MNRLLVICGPTGTGKTNLALSLAKKFNGELISADSRQVYKGLDIGTGKDLPINLKLKTSSFAKATEDKQNSKLGLYYNINGVRVWGYDIVSAKEDFSVSEYLEVARKIIDDIFLRGKLPILIGGTGLYIKGVIEGIPTSVIPKSLSLRNKYKNKTVSELQIILGRLDLNKLSLMNESDRKNPRRLIRAIEVNKLRNKFNYKSETSKNYDTLFVALTSAREILIQRIKERVDDRIKNGFFGEVDKLLKSGVTWNDQSMNALGYKHYQKYLNGEWDIENFKKRWATDEYKYAKRQITWFKKNKEIKWFDISVRNWQIEVEKLINQWYS